MNRIYRRLWSTARQCWVVVSELANSRGKRCQCTGTALAAVLLLVTPLARASSDKVDEEDAVSRNPVLKQALQSSLLLQAFQGARAAGVSPLSATPVYQAAIVTDPSYGNSTVSGDQLLMLGSRSSLNGTGGVAYGNLISATGNNVVAVGYRVKVTNGGYATAVGANAIADGVGTTVFGNHAEAYTTNSVAVGSGARTNNGAGISRIAIGGDAYAGSSGWTGAIALGGDANASHDSVAIGYGARTTQSDSVSLGRGSVASQANTVSVGNDTTKRRIVHVADGNINGTSTDAVNGRQLQTAKNDIKTAADAAAGAQRTANTANTTATTAKSTADQALANSRVVTQASASGSVRVGGDNTGTTVSFANKNNATRYLNGIRNGALSASSTDAVTGQQLFATNSNVTKAQTTADAAKTTATAAQSTANTANTNANTALAKANAVSGLVSQVSATGNVRLGGENTGTVLDVRNKSNAVRGITGLKDGALSTTSTEAVTGKQLNATNTNVSKAQAAADATAAQLNASAVALGAGAVAEQASYGISTALGNNAKAYNGKSVAMGADARATVDDAGNKISGNGGVSIGAGTRSGNGAVALGLDAVATGDRGVAVGHEASGKGTHATALGFQSNASANQATAVGRGAVANSLYASALGNQASATAQSALALGDRASATHAGAVALGNGSATTATNQVSVGNGSLKRKVVNVADAALSTSSSEAVTGKQLHATNASVAAVKATADGAQARVAALDGLVGQVSASGNVRLGAENTGTIVDVANKSGAKRRIYNIANGALSAGSTDAVTGQQLFATNALVETQRQALAGHAQQLTNQDGRIADNRLELDALRADFDNFDPDLDGVVKFSVDRSLVDMEGARVSGVAAGDISSATSTDAVNGGQLFATNERVNAIENAGKFLSIGSDSLSEAARSGSLGVAIGDSAQASVEHEGGTAVGAYANAGGKNSVALGRGALVEKGAESSFALGAGSRAAAVETTAVGANSRVEASAARSVAVGAGSIARESDTVSFGTSLYQRRLVNVSRGIAEGDVSTIAQLNETLAGFGGSAGVDALGNVVGPTYSVQGGKQDNVGDALAALDGAVVRSDSRVDGLEGQLRATFQQSPLTRGDGVGQLNLAGAQGMVLSNLADGRIAAGSRDAVTGSQLYAAKQDIADNRSEIDQMKEQRKGLAGFTRQGPIDFAGARITGLADGDISSASSTDAVNGGQLYTTNSRLTDLEDSQRFLSVGSAGPEVSAKAGLVGVALGDSAVGVGEGATALGSFSRAGGKNSVALGRAAHVMESAEDGFAVGVRSVVDAEKGIAIGAASSVQAGAAYSVAIGSGSIARDALTVSFGEGALQRRLVNVANGRNANDAATIGQLRGALSTFGGNIDGNGNVTTSGFNVQGQHHTTVNDALTTLDSAVVTTDSRIDRVETHLRSVFQETPSTRSDGAAQLTLAGANGMVISNVANGLIAAGSREAVNGGQLHAVQQQLNGRMDGLEQRVDSPPQARAMATASADAGAPTPTPTPTSSESAAATPPVANEGDKAVADSGSAPSSSPTPQPKSKKDDAPAPTPQVDTAELEKMLARANEYTDGAIKGVEQRLDKMDKRFNRMAAMSSAQTAMAMNTAGLATYNRLGAGVGYAEGESAMAVGYQRVLNEKGSATFSLNGAFTNSGERSLGVGVGIGW
ncbi:ESPR-type extended signal peptide-containing protein [Stenotrophomonas sp.]|uniref:ESPR-type extended signal peptide-containing protein n=1 Tax=Stenotrophomonas sp. TaxID=69392 RepID=UPI0028AAF921|nr:ESPR-type extended signal peptide-containing protein [Stenotrophomonas sp.]